MLSLRSSLLLANTAIEISVGVAILYAPGVLSFPERENPLLWVGGAGAKTFATAIFPRAAIALGVASLVQLMEDSSSKVKSKAVVIAMSVYHLSLIPILSELSFNEKGLMYPAYAIHTVLGLASLYESAK